MDEQINEITKVKSANLILLFWALWEHFKSFKSCFRFFIFFKNLQDFCTDDTGKSGM